jgi:small-conductance mechanosensitive channel
LGIALGFAAKDSLANLFAGVFILADGPYKLGDWIVLDDVIRGCVTHVGMRSTRLATLDDVEITIPNGMLANGRILNEMGGVRIAQRVSVPVGVAYASQVPEVRAALLRAAEGVAGICAEPAPVTRFVAFGDSSLNFTLQVWLADPGEREHLVDVLNERILEALRAAHIQIPFPQRDVWMRHAGD